MARGGRLREPRVWGLRSPAHGVGHSETALSVLLDHRCERAQRGPVCLRVAAARQAEDEPLPLELQGWGWAGPGRVPAGPPPRLGLGRDTGGSPRLPWAWQEQGDPGQELASLSLSLCLCQGTKMSSPHRDWQGPQNRTLTWTGQKAWVLSCWRSGVSMDGGG